MRFNVSKCDYNPSGRQCRDRQDRDSVFSIAGTLGKPSARTQACSVRIDPPAQLWPVPDQRIRSLPQHGRKDRRLALQPVGFNSRLTHYRLFPGRPLLRRNGPVPGILAARLTQVRRKTVLKS
jgi:hypothetical protein